MDARRYTTVWVAVSAAVLVACAGTADGRVEKHQLANGVTLLMEPAAWNRIVGIAVVVDAGSKWDPPGLHGLARLTNDLLTRGTEGKSSGELAEILEGHGMSVEGETDLDFAGLRMATVDSHLDLALDLLADMLTRPSFEEGHVLEAQKRLLASLEGGRDELSAAMGKAQEMLFEGHPYAMGSSGTPDGIRSVGRADVVGFYETHYFGSGTVVAIVGNFEPGEVAARLEGALSAYPSGRPLPLALPEMRSERPERVDVYKDVDRSYVVMGFVAPGRDHPDFPAFMVVEGILGFGSFSRLPVLLGAGGGSVSETAGMYYTRGLGQSFAAVFAATGDPERAIGVIEREITRLRTEPVSDEEIRAAGSRIVGDVERKGQRNRARAFRLAWDYLAGLGDDYAGTYLERVRRVDAEDVRRVASTYLVNPVTVVVRPGSSAPSGTEGASKKGGI